MGQKVLIIGSSNTDMVVKTEEFPKPGQTVLGGTFLMNPGGKGANQAVAAARLGADVRFIAKTGNDIFGKQAREGFIKEGLDIQYFVESTELASGVALITVNGNGENEIVVASGANMDLMPADIADEVFEGIEMVLLQLEIPLETVRYVIGKCRDENIKVILNPAPGAKLPDDFLNGLFLITPNETETEIMTGIATDSTETLRKAAQYFHQKGVQNVIITLGSQGVFLSNEAFNELIPALSVKSVDTTAAGDVFNGAILKALASGENWLEACRFACKAAAISVTRMGAQSSAPYHFELI
ncbi:ribokinase [Dyadobacter pollutisoli]|jgi:ribokinase|uniref:Ribokinase n=1 Tax=Dyadobacter pollutisoli TaxID=2910158 RepID=A0A9E8NGV7_9BACT|nr:ribokinase [Dyadobacter pollutisoli]WAC15073.1 ribokinase [Dyadobacter pollutisoli]